MQAVLLEEELELSVKFSTIDIVNVCTEQNETNEQAKCVDVSKSRTDNFVPESDKFSTKKCVDSRAKVSERYNIITLSNNDIVFKCAY